MYSVLCANSNQTASLILTEDSSCQEPIWQSGALIDNSEYDLSDLCFKAETPHVVPFPDFSQDGHGCPIISEKLLQLLITYGVDNLSYYPAKIITADQLLIEHSYYAVNVVGLVSCLDRENSIYEEFRGKVDNLEELVIDNNKAGNHLIFRLEEVPRIILIHEKFDQVFSDNKVIGVQLIPPKLWDCFDGYR